MKHLFFALIMLSISYAVNAYDDKYDILVDEKLNQDEIKYFKQNCKYNLFSYTCIVIQEKIKKEEKIHGQK